MFGKRLKCWNTMPIFWRWMLMLTFLPVICSIAFAIARTGRPGPVLVDVPKDVTGAKCEYEPVVPDRYLPVKKHPVTEAEVDQVISMINASKKPFVMVGGGAVISGASDELRTFVDKIDAPVCSVDILPTLSNLFGVTYDSRLAVGRDVLGNEEAIALWPDYSWVTEKGSYLASSRKFTPAESAEIPDGYVDRINSIVTNKVKFSRMVQNAPFFTKLQEELDKLQ